MKKNWKSEVDYGTKLKINLEKFDRKPVHNDKYIKAKINLYDTNFYGNKSLYYTCFSVTLYILFCNIDRLYCSYR